MAKGVLRCILHWGFTNICWWKSNCNLLTRIYTDRMMKCYLYSCFWFAIYTYTPCECFSYALQRSRTTEEFRLEFIVGENANTNKFTPITRFKAPHIPLKTRKDCIWTSFLRNRVDMMMKSKCVSINHLWTGIVGVISHCWQWRTKSINTDGPSTIHGIDDLDSQGISLIVVAKL